MQIDEQGSFLRTAKMDASVIIGRFSFSSGASRYANWSFGGEVRT